MTEGKIPKLEMCFDGKLRCESCGILYDRFRKDGTDLLGMECPECRLKKRLKEREIR